LVPQNHLKIIEADYEVIGAEDFKRFATFRDYLQYLVKPIYDKAGKPPSGITIVDKVAEKEQLKPRFCYCRTERAGGMIECSGKSCENKWFHLACLAQHGLPQYEGMTRSELNSLTFMCAECKASKSRKRGRKS